MTKTICAAALALALSAPAMAADANGGTLRGRVLQVRNHLTSGGLFRVEVMLFTQEPGGGPYSPLFNCAPSIWDDCEVGDLITGCMPDCENEAGADDTKIEVCHCPTFNPGAGVCLEASPFHDGFALLAESVSILANASCTAVP